MKIRALALGGAFAAIAFASPASAVVCQLTDITPNATDCSGRYSGNVLSNSATNVAIQVAALADIGFTWDGVDPAFGTFDKVDFSTSTIDFATLMVGTTYVGIHVGGRGGGTTSFYVFDAGAGLDTLTLNLPSGSDAVLYDTETPPPPVPEPVSWALMVGGFGMIGSMMRSSKVARVTVA
jgi:hypothetical protein